jgi:Protein of unknown function (DUF2510)
MAVDQVQEWQSDPAGRHRFRLYTDGRPTEWASDGNSIVVDPLPPAQDHPPVPGSSSATPPLAAEPSAPGAPREAAPIDPPVRPAGWYRNAANPDEVRYWDGSEWTTTPAEPAGGTRSNGHGDLGGAEPHADSGDGPRDLGAPGRATNPAQPADWYPDPSDRTRLRYWDGLGWTERVIDEGPSLRS